MAYTKSEDTQGRLVEVPVVNEAEDGSGTSHTLTCNTSGVLKVIQA